MEPIKSIIKSHGLENVFIIKTGDRRVRPLTHSPSCPLLFLDLEAVQANEQQESPVGSDESQIPQCRASSKQEIIDLFAEQIEIISQDDIFLDSLYLLPGESAIINSWLSRRIEGKPFVNGNPVTPLLPFRERIREFFSSDELSRQCFLSLKSTSGGMELIITLKLPIEGHPNPYHVRRAYPIKESNLIDEELPVIALWPNISDLNWKRYFIFSEDQNRGLTVEGYPDYELHSSREEQEMVKYYSCDRFPDLIKLTERNQYRGLIPVNQPPPSSNTSSHWSVGIDFGTSFTNFFINEGSGPVRRTLETRVAPLTLARREFQLNLLYKYFIPETLLPNKNANPPTSTALNTYGWQEVSGKVPKLFHQARIQWPSTNADAFRGPAVRRGFEWNQVQYIRPFLLELALLITCNASGAGAESVEWLISYPSSFIPNQIRNYRRTWEIICSELEAFSDIRQQLRVEGDNISFKSAATAVASYFRNHRSEQLVHAACIKIGRSNTDISIWQDNLLLPQVSVPFAGRDIWTKALKAKPSFIKFLFTPQLTSTEIEDEGKLRQDPSFDDWLDKCLRYDSQELLTERMPIYRAENNKQLLSFVSLMAVGFGGIYHYLGTILKALIKEDRLARKAAMPVYLGGNGARFLHWLDESGAYDKGCEADNLFESLQRKSVCLAPLQRGSASTLMSSAPGDEIACGLLSKGVELKGNDDPRLDPRIAGEECIFNHQAYGSLDRIGMDQEPGVIHQLVLKDLSELKRYVQNYDEAIGELRITTLLPIKKLVDLDNSFGFWDEVEVQARSLCLEKLGNITTRLTFEPPFIICLRALQTTLVRAWAEQY